ncbi:diguanylate cyclase [Desulfococcaceae bacterium HSG8]|nr:diguanylate cyclase [Desulfococcaceae bacterium HSG8]
MTKKNISILIVEDSKTQALYLKISLERQGYQVAVARNGREGLALLQKHFFPVVITDWIMPEMDGFEFCRTVRRWDFPGYVYIILLTTKDSKNDIIAGLKAGADDYLIKPVDEAELAARLNTAKRIIKLEYTLRKRSEEVALLSVTDPLTKAYNRRYLNKNLPLALRHAFRYEHPLSIIICDIDYFKKVNDRYGHQAGDRVLEEFSRYLMQAVRKGTDWVTRYGGEEFLVVLPETNLKGGYRAAERYRHLISKKTILYQKEKINITASFGVACAYPSEDGEEVKMESLIEAADRCLYQAKEDGRNCSVGVFAG